MDALFDVFFAKPGEEEEPAPNSERKLGSEAAEAASRKKAGRSQRKTRQKKAATPSSRASRGRRNRKENQRPQKDSSPTGDGDAKSKKKRKSQSGKRKQRESISSAAKKKGRKKLEKEHEAKASGTGGEVEQLQAEPEGESPALSYDPVDEAKEEIVKIEVERRQLQGASYERLKPAGTSFPMFSNEETPLTAHHFKFQLDPWQTAACTAIEASESVLVSAHTSAGKTAVAEYAIAKALRDKQRIIYTSPIKALSNQKFRELRAIFNDVGLMTGDVSMGASASCIIMTTEIFRSMLYRGSQLTLETACIVFDEVHYLRDRTRGVIWEEVMILLPETIQMVFLSATIPNPKEFASWIVGLKRRPCHVICTNHRPVPLRHALMSTEQEAPVELLDSEGVFNDDNYQATMATLDPSAQASSSRKRRVRHVSGSSVEKVIKWCVDKSQLPLIVFSFSRKDCENHLLALKKLDVTTDAEKLLVTQVFESAVKTLADADRSLPQVASLLPVLRRGVGLHHSGLLPIMRELVEIMFSESLIKVLLSTETFAMGMNMPAKTVVFTSLRKWDGLDFRLLSPGEYVQMSGRAGRRGKDQHGLALTMAVERLEAATLKQLFHGEATKLESAFHLSFNMLLNLMRTEGHGPEHFLKQSFLFFQRAAKQRQFEDERARIRADMEGMSDLRKLIEGGDKHDVNISSAVEEHFRAARDLAKLQEQLREVVYLEHPELVAPFLQRGRLAMVSIEGTQQSTGVWGLILTSPRTKQIRCQVKKQEVVDEDDEDEMFETTWLFDVLVPKPCESKSEDPISASRPKAARGTGGGEGAGGGGGGGSRGGKGKAAVTPHVQLMSTSCLMKLSKVKANLPDGDPQAGDFQRIALKILNEICDHFTETGIPLLDPKADLGVQSEALEALLPRVESAEAVLSQSSVRELPELPTLLDAVSRRIQLQLKGAELDRELLALQTSVVHGDLRSMRRVLHRLQFIDATGMVHMKGRMACEIACAGSEVLLTEVVFRNIFKDISGAGIIALCSCFVLDERPKGAAELPAEHHLRPVLEAMQEVSKELLVVLSESGMQLKEGALPGWKLHPEFVEGVLAWLSGKTFYEVSTLCNLYEGTLVRVLRRLDDLARELATAAQVIGNVDLAEKVKEGRALLKRGIVFAPSLYL